MKFKNEVTKAIWERLEQNPKRIDLSDLPLESKSSFYYICKRKGISAKDVEVIWPKGFLEKWNAQRREYMREYQQATKRKNKQKSKPRITVRSVTEEETKAYLEPNRNVHYKRLLKQNKELKEENEALTKELEKQLNQQHRIKVLEKEKMLLEKRIHELKTTVDNMKKEFDNLLSEADLYDTLQNKAKVVCPVCGELITNKPLLLASNHLLFTCEHCKASYATRREQIEVIFKIKEDVC